MPVSVGACTRQVPSERDHALMTVICAEELVGLASGAQERAHVKAWWAWWKGRVKGQEEQRHVGCRGKDLPEALSTLEGAHLTPCVFTVVPPSQPPGSSAFPYTTQMCPTWAVLPARSCSGGPGVYLSSDTSSPP